MTEHRVKALSVHNENDLRKIEALRDEIKVLKAKVEVFVKYFINAENDAGYLVVNADETQIDNIRDALIAVVFHDDSQEFLMMVDAAHKALGAEHG